MASGFTLRIQVLEITLELVKSTPLLEPRAGAMAGVLGGYFVPTQVIDGGSFGRTRSPPLYSTQIDPLSREQYTLIRAEFLIVQVIPWCHLDIRYCHIARRAGMWARTMLD